MFEEEELCFYILVFGTLTLVLIFFLIDEEEEDLSLFSFGCLVLGISTYYFYIGISSFFFPEDDELLFFCSNFGTLSCTFPPGDSGGLEIPNFPLGGFFLRLKEEELSFFTLVFGTLAFIFFLLEEEELSLPSFRC